MPSSITQLNRTGVALLTASTETLSCTIPNGSVDLVIEITHISYGYNYNVAAPFSATFGKGACQVIQNHQLVEGINFYTPTSPTLMEGRSGEYIEFDVVNSYGTKNIYFVPPLRVEPALNCVVVVPYPADQAGSGLNAVALLTVHGRAVMLDKNAQRVGDYVLR